MKLIGRGAFSKVYLQNNGKKVTIKSTCPAKAMLAERIGMPTSSLFPRLTKLRYQEYEMEYLPRPKSLKKSLIPLHWEYYKCLKELYDRGSRDFKSIPYPHLRIAMVEAYEGFRNYTSMPSFEISPRNVTVKNGRLVLLDVFYCEALLISTY